MNMSYCRFENTLTDLRDCFEAMNQGTKCNDSEQVARAELIELCIVIAAEHGPKVGIEVTSRETLIEDWVDRG